MHTTMIFACLVLLSVTTLVGCSKSAPTSPSATGNLLSNPSFELNGSPSLEGWSQAYADTNVFSFSSDVPPGGGKYSAAIDAVWGPQYTISQTVSVDPGNHQYEFSVWAKKVGVGGQLKLYLKRADSLLFMKSTNVADTTWTDYTIIDTFSIESGDSLQVALTGGFSQLLAGTTLFDLCELKELE